MGKRRGHARRHSRQPFPWTCIYEFVLEDGETYLLSGEVLNLGMTRPRRREQELAKRKGPCFHAISNGRHGVARLVPGSLPSFAWWDFLGDDGVLRTVPDSAIEVFQCWGDPTAVNVWKGRIREEARKIKRRAAQRRQFIPQAHGPVAGGKGQAMTGLFRPTSGTTARSVTVCIAQPPARSDPLRGRLTVS